MSDSGEIKNLDLETLFGCLTANVFSVNGNFNCEVKEYEDFLNFELEEWTYSVDKIVSEHHNEGRVIVETFDGTTLYIQFYKEAKFNELNIFL